MAAKITRKHPTDTDAVILATHLRLSDIEELKAVTELTPLQAIQVSIFNSVPEFLWAYYADDTLLCIAGCSRTGNPWLLATPALQAHTLQLTKTAKQGVRMMLKTYPMLSNMIDVRQTQTIRWLEAIGFTMMDTLEIKPGYPVIRFIKVRNERTIKNSTQLT